MRFQRGQLGGLQLGHGLALLVARKAQQQHKNQGKDRRHLERCAEKFNVAFAQQMPGRNAQHKKAAKCPRGKHGMGIHAPGVAVGHHFPEVGKFGAPHGFIDGVTYGVLHKAVGKNDPERRKVARKGHNVNGSEVHFFANTVPAKVPNGKKCGFQKKGHCGFNGQQRTKNIPHIFRIARPVCTKLEFQRDARHHAQGKVDEKKFSPKFGLFFPEFVAGANITGFHPGKNDGKTEGERHEYKMEKNGHSELQTRKHYNVHVGPP